MAAFTAVAVAAISALAYILIRHESRPLKVGSGAVPSDSKLPQHESWNAVVDNYVYIHNAFRNHLVYIRMKCEQKVEDGSEANVDDILKDLGEWNEILNLHSRVEDELLIPALLARLNAEEKKKKIPDNITSGDDHDSVKRLIDDILNNATSKPALVLEKMKELESLLDEHLLREETHIMPLFLEKFTTRELWALDSFIVNEKLGYCDKDMLIKITKWWFGNLSVKEGWPLLNNFIAAGNQPEMPLEEWKKLQDTIPALQKFPTEALVS